MKETDQTQDALAFFGPVISSYSRAQAIADGVLVDASTMARDAGFQWPVALTAAVWADCVTWSEEDNRQQTYQDASGRLWDVLFMASMAIRSRAAPDNPLLFSLYRVPRDGRSRNAEDISLKIIVGPGDQGEPVITILRPDED